MLAEKIGGGIPKKKSTKARAVFFFLKEILKIKIFFSKNFFFLKNANSW